MNVNTIEWTWVLNEWKNQRLNEKSQCHCKWKIDKWHKMTKEPKSTKWNDNSNNNNNSNSNGSKTTSRDLLMHDQPKIVHTSFEIWLLFFVPLPCYVCIYVCVCVLSDLWNVFIPFCHIRLLESVCVRVCILNSSNDFWESHIRMELTTKKPYSDPKFFFPHLASVQ